MSTQANRRSQWVERCLESLAANRMSRTRQRVKLLEVLASSTGHITADRLLAGVQKAYPDVNKSTIYRTLELLAQMGLVAIGYRGSNQVTYEVLENPHHHLVCKVCHEEVELADSTLDSLRQVIQQEHGFQPCFDHFVVFGVCPECQQSADVTSPS